MQSFTLTFTSRGNLESPINLPPQGEHANSTQKGPDPDSNSGHSCCEATVLTTATAVPPSSDYMTDKLTVNKCRINEQIN